MHSVTLIGIILIAGGTALTFWGQDLKSKKDKVGLNKQISELIDGKDEVIRQNQELSERIIAYQEDLKSKDEKIRKLEKGVTSSYDFDGSKRISDRPGHLRVDVGKETETFKEILALEKQKDYQELVPVCEAQIRATPDWLTPHFFLGIGYGNLGRQKEAAKKFEYVIKNSHEDPAYAQADALLKQLRRLVTRKKD